MSEKLELLERKVSQVLNRVDDLRAENDLLREANVDLKDKLVGLKRDFDALKLEQNDLADRVKTKLVSILSRVEELEKIGL